MLTIKAARLAARQKDSAGDLLSVPGVKIWGQPVRGPGDRGPGVGFPRSVHNFSSYLANTQTNKNQQKHYLLGGGNNSRNESTLPGKVFSSREQNTPGGAVKSLLEYQQHRVIVVVV